MKVRYFVLGAAALFFLLLILGAIFAIKAHVSGEDAQAPDPAPIQSSAQTAAPTPAAPTPAIPASSLVSNSSTPTGDADPSSIGYTVLASAGAGRTLFIQKPDSITPQSAIIAALHDISRLLDSKPTVLGAFADSQEQHRGGAIFSGAYHAQPVKGTIMCGIGDKGAAITILYNRPDAPASDWQKLTTALPLSLQMQTQTIGDGAATISIPPNWKILSSSNLGSVVIQGPAQQTVALGQGLEIVEPGSMGANVQNQLAASGQLTPATRMIVSPFAPPADAIKNITPQLSDMSASRGGPTFTLGEILQNTPLAPQLPNGQAARLYYKSTLIQNARQIPFRSWSQIECYVVGSGTWGMLSSSVSSPDATFDADLPTMLTIANSWKLNDAVVAAHSQQNIAASNARFSAFEESMKEKQDAFDGYLKSVQRNELIQERSNADFDEVIRGYRTVYDTESGEHYSADLGNIDQIVNRLNEHNPGRYVQIPLRDEEFPLEPAH